MKGNGVKRGYTLTEADITDVAPTILYLMGCPIPEDFDGKVLVDAFEPSFIKSHSVRYRESAEEGISAKLGVVSKEDIRKIEEQLRGLGYME